MSKADTGSLMARLIRFEELLDRMEGLLRVSEGTAPANPPPVLTPEAEKYLREAQVAADKYVKRRKWEMAKERGDVPVEADLA